MPVARTHVETSGATFVQDGDHRASFVQQINAGRMFEVDDISGSTFWVNPHAVVAVLVRNDPE